MKDLLPENDSLYNNARKCLFVTSTENLVMFACPKRIGSGY
jgi:hypothetical protein